MGEVSPLPRLPERRPRPAGEERRQAILVAIEELLREKPLADISVRDITSEAGVVRSGFYFYFSSKGAAVTALLGDLFEHMVTGATRFLRDEPDPVAGVDAALRATWEAWRDHQGLILAMLDARGADPAVRELWDAWIDRFVVPVAAVIEEQGAAGVARRDHDPRELVTVLISANERTFERLSRTGAGSGRIDAAIDALVTVWVSTLYPSDRR